MGYIGVIIPFLTFYELPGTSNSCSSKSCIETIADMSFDLFRGILSFRKPVKHGYMNKGKWLGKYSHPMEHLGNTKKRVRLLVKKKVYTPGKKQHFEPRVMEVFGSDDFPDFKWVIFRFHVYFQGSSQELWIFDFCGAKLRPVSRRWAPSRSL